MKKIVVAVNQEIILEFEGGSFMYEASSGVLYLFESTITKPFAMFSSFLYVYQDK